MTTVGFHSQRICISIVLASIRRFADLACLKLLDSQAFHLQFWTFLSWVSGVSVKMHDIERTP